MLLLGHWPALVGADARLFELRPVAGIDGSSLMGHRVGLCVFSPITLVDSAIPIISVLQAAEEALACRVVRAAVLPRHGADQAVSLAYADPPGPSVMAPLSEWQTGRWPGASVLHASSREPLARAAFGRLPMRHETTRPSKQSMTGLRYESESESESDPFLLAS